MSPDILICARKERVQHKITSEEDPMTDIEFCYWTGIHPKRKPLGKVMFCQKGSVYAEGKILGVDDFYGLMFEPLDSVDYPVPKKAPTKGFTYVEEIE